MKFDNTILQRLESRMIHLDIFVKTEELKQSATLDIIVLCHIQNSFGGIPVWSYVIGSFPYRGVNTLSPFFIALTTFSWPFPLH